VTSDTRIYGKNARESSTGPPDSTGSPRSGRFPEHRTRNRGGRFALCRACEAQPTERIFDVLPLPNEWYIAHGGYEDATQMNQRVPI
jgi:hypothetical protein